MFCDQVEYHPLLGQERLLELARERDLLVTAQSGPAHGRVPDDATLAEIGEAHGKTAGQVALRWLLDQPNVSPIPKTSSHERGLENFEVFNIELSDDERARIDGLPKDDRQMDPDFGPAGTPDTTNLERVSPLPVPREALHDPARRRPD